MDDKLANLSEDEYYSEEEKQTKVFKSNEEEVEESDSESDPKAGKSNKGIIFPLWKYFYVTSHSFSLL